MSNRLVVVVGATGAQGGSVVDHLLQDGKWKIRGLTRKVDSDKAKELTSKGVEMVSCDIGKSDQVTTALKGAYAVFAVTNFWEAGAEAEQTQGKLLGDIAEQVGVKHFVWSSLPNSERESKGKFKVPHFTGKALVEDHLKTKKFQYFTSVVPGFYYENFLTFFPPKANPDGTYAITMPLKPDKPIWGFSVADIGKPVVAALNDPARWAGKSLAGYAGPVTPEQVVAVMSKLSGKTVKFNEVPASVFAQFPFPGAGELAEMFEWFTEYGLFGKEIDLDLAKQFNYTSLEEFLKKVGWKLQ